MASPLLGTQDRGEFSGPTTINTALTIPAGTKGIVVSVPTGGDDKAASFSIGGVTLPLLGGNAAGNSASSWLYGKTDISARTNDTLTASLPGGAGTVRVTVLYFGGGGLAFTSVLSGACSTCNSVTVTTTQVLPGAAVTGEMVVIGAGGFYQLTPPTLLPAGSTTIWSGTIGSDTGGSWYKLVSASTAVGFQTSGLRFWHTGSSMAVYLTDSPVTVEPDPPMGLELGFFAPTVTIGDDATIQGPPPLGLELGFFPPEVSVDGPRNVALVGEDPETAEMSAVPDVSIDVPVMRYRRRARPRFEEFLDLAVEAGVTGGSGHAEVHAIDGAAHTGSIAHSSLSTVTADQHHNEDHASRHASGGADAVKLDDLAAPDDNTDLNVSTSAHGLTPKLPNDAAQFLNGVGGYAVPPGGPGLLAVVGVIFDAPAVSSKLWVEVPFACTITAARMFADVSGSVVVDIWKDTYANYPPTIADTITASAKPTISSATKSQDTTLTGWTVSVAAGDILLFNVNSVTTIARLSVMLTVSRT